MNEKDSNEPVDDGPSSSERKKRTEDVVSKLILVYHIFYKIISLREDVEPRNVRRRKLLFS